MRRVHLGARSVCAVSGVLTCARSAELSSLRNIYTTWVDIPQEPQFKKESWLRRITSQYRYRSFDFWHVPVVDTPDGVTLNNVERYLLSCIEDDTRRLINIEWGYDFDPFWRDRVQSHEKLFDIIYGEQFHLSKFIFGNCAHKTAEKEYMSKKLNYLKSVLHWAEQTERRYSALTKIRYHVQRCVWNALERERYLCACVEAVDSFGKIVPEEFRAKAMSELELKLTNMRHWINDCPNGKRTFTRSLA